MEIDYDKLKKIATEARAELVMRGDLDIGKGKIRKKPRDKQKENLLLLMATLRMEKYKPRREGTTIVLPYFEY